MLMKKFPADVQVSNEEIKETGGSDWLLQILWDRFPSLQDEFIDFENFSAYARSVVEGRSQACNAHGTMVSRQSDRVYLAF